MNTRKLFCDEDKQKINTAIKETEKKTSAEIILSFYDTSDTYIEAYWKSGALFSMFFSFISIIITFFDLPLALPFDLNNSAVFFIGLLLFFLLGAFIALIIPFYRRIIIGKEVIHYYTELKAHEIFLKEEIFLTKKRTGILIFISFFEKSVTILADKGINEKVTETEWQEVLKFIIKGLKGEELTLNLINAINQCGELLLKSGLAVEKDDINELSDEIRFGELT